MDESKQAPPPESPNASPPESPSPKSPNASPERKPRRRKLLKIVHDNVVRISGIVVALAAIVTAIVGLAGREEPPRASPSSTAASVGHDARDVAAFCEAWRGNTNLNAVMAGFVQQAASHGSPEPEQIARVSSELVRASDRAATLAPSVIKTNVREYARLQEQIGRHLSLQRYRLYSTTDEEASAVTSLFEPMTKEMARIELWSRENC